VEKEEDYTEHKAEIHHANGDTTEITFDEMRRDGEVIILETYVDIVENTHRGCGYPSERTTYMGFEAEKFMTIPLENLNRFHTVKRTDKSWTYEETETETKPMSEVGDDEEVTETFDVEEVVEDE